MEKVEQKWEQAEVEEQEEEETTLIGRKSRNEKDSKNTEEIAALDVEVSNGGSESNGHTVESEVAANGAEDEESVLGEGKKMEELGGVLENELEATNEEQKLEELDGVLENEPKAINGEPKPENLVFYHKAEGIWKCRICTWTYQNGSVHVDHIQNHRGQLHKLMNVKTLNFESEGIESASTYFGEKEIVEDSGHRKFNISSHDFVVQSSPTAINRKDEGGLENYGFSSPNLQSSQISSQEHSTEYKSSNEIESAEVDLDDLEVTELDVERVLQKQTTHDLYCPNCNSCITKRVILRKRKRRIRVSDEEVKRNKIKTDSKLGTASVQSPSDLVHHTDDPQLATADEDDRDRGPYIFRCLSCFSFFMPTRKGFKLFPTCEEKSAKENARVEQAPTIKKNWFISMFAPNKQETAVEQGSSSQTDLPQGEVGVIQSSNVGDQSGQPSFMQTAHSPSHASEGLQGTAGNNDNLEGTGTTLPSIREKPSLSGRVIIDAGDKLEMTATQTVDTTMEQLDAYTGDHLKESKSIEEVNINHLTDLSVTTLPQKTQVTNGEYAENAFSFSPQDGLKMLISPNKGSLNNSEEGQIPDQTLQARDKDAIQVPPASVEKLKASDVDGKVNIPVSIPHEEQDVTTTVVTQSVFENEQANFGSSDSGQNHPTEVSQQIITKTKAEVLSREPLKVDNISTPIGATVAQGKYTVITIDAQPAVSSQTVEGVIHPAATASALQPATQISTSGRERTEAREEYQIEVIKSLVYGGLAESITSLSVVSSAAGGGAATLNTLALGAANLIGGFFVLCHNLWELKGDRVEQVANQVSDVVAEQRDRYKELLGRRQNFILHAVVSIISYLIFGLVPPVVYGFSFHKTDDRQLKLVVVAAASLLCIVLLAIGRAYVCRPHKPYLKTVVTFVILGFMVSGVSYAAGELVERLLEKLGLFQSGSVSSLLLPEMTPTGSARASY